MAASLFKLILVFLLAAVAGCGDRQTVTATPGIELEPCRLRGSSGLTSAAAHCGYLTVAENPAEPDGRTIDLFIAKLPAINPRYAGTAFTAIAGGPGQASTEFYADYAAYFERILRNHDILLVDQRGTGRSNALNCNYDESDLLDFSPELAAAQAKECLQTLPGDPRYYTTSVAVADLDQVRAALGYEKLDIYGVSYGTRVGLHYLKRYPERTRTLTIDGVVTPVEVLGPRIAIDAQHALEEIFARCHADDACKSRFDDLSSGFARLQEQLRDEPVQLSLQAPVSGELTPVTLDYNTFASAVRLLSYAPRSAALLPLIVHDAYANANWMPLAAQAQMALASMADMLSEGMHNAIVCTEDTPFFEIDADHRERLKQTYMGELQVDALTHICDIWPAGILDADFHDPLSSDKPVLLMSGTADPVTPPRNGELTAETLPNSRHLVVEGHGHGVLTVACVPTLIAEFVDSATLDDLDTECVHRQKPAPFFMQYTGPLP